MNLKKRKFYKMQTNPRRFFHRRLLLVACLLLVPGLRYAEENCKTSAGSSAAFSVTASLKRAATRIMKEFKGEKLYVAIGGFPGPAMA